MTICNVEHFLYFAAGGQERKYTAAGKNQQWVGKSDPKPFWVSTQHLSSYLYMVLYLQLVPICVCIMTKTIRNVEQFLYFAAGGQEGKYTAAGNNQQWVGKSDSKPF